MFIHDNLGVLSDFAFHTNHKTIGNIGAKYIKIHQETNR